ncbi:hypothetical protein BTO20_31285 [Mycobacterium dioxanotrophicus]|jgi:2-polyprenyl-6-methoxyphenol hydroxylase-like FAD-dependent oxidoreductase|uniref:FAD-binding domain-containing protein n=1 Tax=Mycobacterium dioxanotrophicus TaxID=482462 RepID=A0A1Y0CBP4_9MYCO|nr:FAD-dependent monooxygenase [Mycobacterium dioxanotrophicus]ART72446.1 hypothetical protein BTO20_31285 [Mycobacterium dioxanotrophicus]
MRIVCVGGGPAGLYFALLMKRARPGHEVVVLDRRPPGHAGGWGVTVWDDLLTDLRSTDNVAGSLIADSAVKWDGLVVDRAGERVLFDGDCYGIARSVVLDVLTERAIALGVDVRFGTEILDTHELADADVVVACDGVRSALRDRDARRFGTAVTLGKTRFVWLGTTKVFDRFTFAFVSTPAGWIWCYAYAFDLATSTFIVECGEETWRGLGLDAKGADDALAVLEQLFAGQLDGRPLLSGDGWTEPSLPWQNFPTVTNDRWFSGKVVLMGDAAHTTHFSIGSGMRLALQDAICLAEQLQTQRTVAEAFATYEKTRRTALIGPATEARFSREWFENFDRYADLPAPALCALLRARRDPLMAKIPPQVYWRIDRVVNSVGFMRALRHRVGPVLRTLYGRYAATKPDYQSIHGRTFNQC